VGGDGVHVQPVKIWIPHTRAHTPVFDSISYKTRAILHCENWNAYCARATVESLQKESPEFIPSQLWPPNSPDLNAVDNSIWEILYKTRITDLKTLINDATPPTNGCCNDDMSLAHSVLSHCFSSFRSVMRILYTFSCNAPTRCNQLDSNLANLGATVEVK